MGSPHEYVRIRGARENNLRSVDVDVPKRHLTVVTGVSGSGKSSLVFGTVAAEAQRQLNDTFTAFARNRLPQYGQPEADLLDGLSPAVVVDQRRLGGNARSTVGTVTDASAMLRLVYSRAGEPWTGYSHVFSFNDPEGMCPDCQGLGQRSHIDTTQLLDTSLSLNEGAIRFPTFAVGNVFWQYYAESGLFDNDRRLRDYTTEEWNALLWGTGVGRGSGRVRGQPAYEGLIPRMERVYLHKDPEQKKGELREALRRVVVRATCPSCGGARLNPRVLDCRVAGLSIAEAAAMPVAELAAWVADIDAPQAKTAVDALLERLTQMVTIGLGYVSPDRPTTTLSGGESQRVRMVRHLGSSLTDMLYVLDEPTVGLHPANVADMTHLLHRLRDNGNTVLVVEHDADVIAAADHVVEIGPGAGNDGGRVTFQGPYQDLAGSGTATERAVRTPCRVKEEVRAGGGELTVTGARAHNLRGVSVSLPTGAVTAVVGVAGSGKSTLVNDELCRLHPDAVVLDQGGLHVSRRSNPASYLGVLDPIRSLFARENRAEASLFSPNSAGGCPDCDGQGLIHTDLAFLDPVTTVCETCEGRRFTGEALSHTVRGATIADVLEMSIAEAHAFFPEPAVRRPLTSLVTVGLGYLGLGQPLTTLSGGERQRVKLATELATPARTFVFDEPTTGLHRDDTASLTGVFDHLADNGAAVVVIEHNLDMVGASDWVVELGPGAGDDGGRVVFTGTPRQLLEADTVTGEHFRRARAGRG
ncbi:excinuclease ABC A subunit [Haloactinospora alba]|uniref:UvrABC system protein A n=1 Tax=Haloactinospora alba TaxID=405555 RepID=A0A543N7H3_9ACTN|nr:excinuclease ABC subunit UvrA [Haloactinospora alba]TQN27758.1 excinuclease ABC A subunit [Haloactinospora alba]